jgi:hypothetical protein
VPALPKRFLPVFIFPPLDHAAAVIVFVEKLYSSVAVVTAPGSVVPPKNTALVPELVEEPTRPLAVAKVAEEVTQEVPS